MQYRLLLFLLLNVIKEMNISICMELLCNEALKFFKAAVKAVQPQVLIENAVKLTPTMQLQIHSLSFPVNHNVYVVGFGKAVLGMALAVEHILGDHLVSGIISVPKGIQKQFMMHSGAMPNLFKIKVFEGAANNLPDEESMKAAMHISDLVSSLKVSDLLVVLISGGGSSLLPLPIAPITLSEKLLVIKLLASQGASIQELNVVRKRLSALKGGGLAKLAEPSQVVSLIISDIIGNPLDLIASSPTVENTDDPTLPLTILEKYNLYKKVPPNVLNKLHEISIKKCEFSSEKFNHVANILIGTNEDAVKAAVIEAEKLGYTTIVLTLELQGVARVVGKALASLIYGLLNDCTNVLQKAAAELSLSSYILNKLLIAYSHSVAKSQGLCIFCAGETVVQVTGNGVGGRNQEVALATAIEFDSLKIDSDVVLLSAGTDGIDGPTNAAGAIATPLVIKAANEANLCALDYLNNNDSFNFYSHLNHGQWHVMTGHTGTNVMDIIVILIKKRNDK